ncbi:hypothetical protein Nepgr_023839 [Nepenthes gracilis]|uniref:Uncharacterized protein n=1 Tax=Nepenthes gracilis TaxID=150966 RepID=A0AAD3T512_NEPGR|nr:hypothetical protein Nepgr_023839 [Nepenthes gracilis]
MLSQKQNPRSSADRERGRAPTLTSGCRLSNPVKWDRQALRWRRPELPDVLGQTQRHRALREHRPNASAARRGGSLPNGAQNPRTEQGAMAFTIYIKHDSTKLVSSDI